MCLHWLQCGYKDCLRLFPELVIVQIIDQFLCVIKIPLVVTIDGLGIVRSQQYNRVEVCATLKSTSVGHQNRHFQPLNARVFGHSVLSHHLFYRFDQFLVLFFSPLLFLKLTSIGTDIVSDHFIHSLDVSERLESDLILLVIMLMKLNNSLFVFGRQNDSFLQTREQFARLLIHFN